MVADRDQRRTGRCAVDGRAGGRVAGLGAHGDVCRGEVGGDGHIGRGGVGEAAAGEVQRVVARLAGDGEAGERGVAAGGRGGDAPTTGGDAQPIGEVFQNRVR